ncbi:Metallopeptidase, catalytic domain [Lasallia pustulata]|uniref:Metallopeptidase, catalytic domain n=1 Tax=Lasallia pustulata TaxID=136370 RepID=A0A1W5CU61_9LECA|nr:Metallopeptidase, catalytic domain [Lasallia pustulata]
MTRTARLILTAAALLWTARTCSAIPRPSPNDIGSLFKRANVQFQDCGDENDAKRIKAGRAWSEAANLAEFTIDGSLDDKTKFQGTNAYKHYFEDADSTQVNAMFGSIQAGSSGDSGNAFQLNFIISCKETDACKDALAVTDSAPATSSFTPIIRLCPLFFTDDRTKNFLDSKSTKRDPGRRDNSWCQPNQPFSFFETAGHTFLHEMTHLDQLGVAAGLSERDTNDPNIKSHGTDDIYAIAKGYDPTSPERSARKLKDNWTKYNGDHKNKPELERVENAEGYAASATEFWFQSKCGFTDILP